MSAAIAWIRSKGRSQAVLLGLSHSNPKSQEVVLRLINGDIHRFETPGQYLSENAI